MSSKNRLIHLHINKIKPKTYICNFCGKISLYHEYANIGHGYTRDIDLWIELCHSCHRLLDYGNIEKLFKEVDIKSCQKKSKQH